MREIPQIVVTNDWFAGLVPAYAKVKKFGDVFEVHNEITK
jgi:glycogen synthase